MHNDSGYRDDAVGHFGPANSVRSNVMCHFCHKKGHLKADCYALNKNKQMSLQSAVLAPTVPQLCANVPIHEVYLPFVSSGFVSH